MSENQRVKAAEDGGQQAPVLRPDGWRKRGKEGWSVASAKKARGTPWAIDVGPIQWTHESFWRVGLCVEREYMTEVTHLRYPTENEAIEAVTWLVAVAKENA